MPCSVPWDPTAVPSDRWIEVKMHVHTIDYGTIRCRNSGRMRLYLSDTVIIKTLHTGTEKQRKNRAERSKKTQKSSHLRSGAVPMRANVAQRLQGWSDGSSDHGLGEGESGIRLCLRLDCSQFIVKLCESACVSDDCVAAVETEDDEVTDCVRRACS